VEMLTREGVSWEERLGDGDRCVLHLTTFGVSSTATTGSSPPRLAGLLARTSSPAIGAASIGKRFLGVTCSDGSSVQPWFTALHTVRSQTEAFLQPWGGDPSVTTA
jgi:hypothetical protein